MKIIVTTSDNYHHLLPIFFYLYNKYWGAPFELVGHKKPECELPDNCTWVSLGEQLGKEKWSDQLRPYFEQQPDWFVWMMEDTFLKDDVRMFGISLESHTAGRIDLTNDIQKREHSTSIWVYASPSSRYRLSTQPSIWNKQFLLQYLTPGLSPWDFETQDPKNDGWDVVGFINPPVLHNEGVRRHDIYKLNLDGMKQEDIDHIKTLITW
jgi:hypothetical protein